VGIWQPAKVNPPQTFKSKGKFTLLNNQPNKLSMFSVGVGTIIKSSIYCVFWSSER